MMKGCFLLLGWMFILEATFAVPASADDSAPQSNDGQGNCKPFKAYFVWDHSKANFVVERKYINKLIDSTAFGTDIILNMLDGDKKNFTNTGSVHTKTDKIRIIENVSKISYSDLQKDISEHSQGNTEQAFVLFFFVNKNTHLDQKETELKDFLKKIKVFVVSIFEPVPDFWKSLATDKDHVLQVENYADSKTNAFLDLICQDSRLVCDNQMYWSRTKCLPCANISCESLCPYFGKCAPGKSGKKSVDESKKECVENVCSCTLHIILIVILGLAIIGVIVFYECYCMKRRRRTDSHDSPDVLKGKRDDWQSQAKEPEHAVKVQFDNIRRRKKNDSAK